MKQTVNRQEIQQLLADPGYSGDDRDERLKQALTVLSSEEADAGNPDGERSKLIADIRREIDRQAVDPGEPSEDR